MKAAPPVRHASRNPDPGTRRKQSRTKTLEHSTDYARIDMAIKVDGGLPRELNMDRSVALRNQISGLAFGAT